MSTEKEYNVAGNLCNDKSKLEADEVFLRFPNWRVFRRLFFNWIESEQPLDVTVRALRHKRSLAQNRWIWLVCNGPIRAWILETEGEKKSKEDIYLYLNSTVLGNKFEVATILGEEVIRMTGKRFSQMNTMEFSESVEKICQFFEPKGLIVPLPKDNNLLDDFITDDN
jgi:hypothetical protein